MIIDCLVIDDEPLARGRLIGLIDKTPELNCIGESKTGKEAIKMIETKHPDLIFLDIKMKDMSGFDVLKRLKTTKKPVVIFVTAFDEFALKAFDYSAFDYLLKPFKKDRFDSAVKRVLAYIEKNNQPNFQENLNNLMQYLDPSKRTSIPEKIKGKLPIKIGRTVTFLDVDTIKYIQASGSYIDICTDAKVYVLRSSLTEVLKDIDNATFRRIHRSTIINIDFISKLIHSPYGEIDVKMNDDKLFRVSGSYKKTFLKILGV